jgi:tRNA 2-thiouridine synthesizing protein A
MTNQDELTVQHQLDAQDLFCPEPVMMLHNVIRKMAAGERVRIIATDPSTQRDIPKFCQFLGHTLIDNYTDTAQDAKLFVYIICKVDKKSDSPE